MLTIFRYLSVWILVFWSVFGRFLGTEKGACALWGVVRACSGFYSWDGYCIDEGVWKRRNDLV